MGYRSGQGRGLCPRKLALKFAISSSCRSTPRACGTDLGRRTVGGYHYRNRLSAREISPPHTFRRSPIPTPRAPAVEYEYADGGGRVGFIASVSRFRSASIGNRLRLDGGRQAALLPFCDRRRRRQGSAARQRRSDERDCHSHPAQRGRQVARTRNQLAEIRCPAPPYVFDWRLRRFGGLDPLPSQASSLTSKASRQTECIRGVLLLYSVR